MHGSLSTGPVRLTQLARAQGFVYVLDAKGTAKPGWPLQMGEVQAQVAAADVDGDGMLEIVAGDVRGTLAAFTRDGTELWERHVASSITQVGHGVCVHARARVCACVGCAWGNVHGGGGNVCVRACA